MLFGIACFLNCLLSVSLVKGYKVLHLDINNINNDAPSNNVIKKELIKEIINIVQLRNGIPENNIQKCISKQKTNVNKLLCIKNLYGKKATTRPRRKSKNQYLSDLFGLSPRDFTDLSNKNKKSSKIFLDLTRDSADDISRKGLFSFADDYVDFTGIGRSRNKPKSQEPESKKIYFYKPGRNNHKKLNRRNINDNFVAKKILRTNLESDSDMAYSDSDSEDLTRNDRKITKYEESSQESNSSDESDDYVRPKPKRVVRKDPFRYMQGPTRIFEVELDRRRRLSHFLPKRLHWDENDFKDLRDHWIHGPQGKYPGAYRIPF